MSDSSSTAQPHSFVDRLLGRHEWTISNDSFYYFHQGGVAELRYNCRCGAKKTRRWDGEYEEGRDLTKEERDALGPYL